jgi:hypothetical protein
MARRISSNNASLTPAAVADAPTAFTSGQALFFSRGGSATQFVRWWEFSISGMAASSSSPTPIVFSRDSAVSVGALSYSAATSNDSFMDPFTAALAAVTPIGNVAATTYPQRSATDHLLACGLNAFGGVYFWRANRAEECPAMYGTAVTVGDVSFSCYTGGTPGAVNWHAIYETS